MRSSTAVFPSTPAHQAYRPARLPFFGRDDLLNGLAGTLRHTPQCIALVGPGGLGKTRTAYELIARMDWPAVVCPLADCRDTSALHADLARSLGLTLRPTRRPPQVQLGEALATLGAAVVLLDNVEQIAPFVSAALADWSKAAPDLRFLLTSRVAIDGVRIQTLGGLPEADAVQLFVDRARRLVPDFATHADEAALVSTVIGPLGGLPLAIELAAPWVQVYALPELAAALADAPIEVLGGHADANPVEAIIESAWRRLDLATQQVLLHAALMRGPFTMTALSAVSQITEVPFRLRGLREAQLVVEAPRAAPQAKRRFRVLPLIRAFCLSHWPPQALTAAHRRHAAWLVGPIADVEQLTLACNFHIAAVPQAHMPDLEAAARALPLDDPLCGPVHLTLHKGRLDWGPEPTNVGRLDALIQHPATSRRMRWLLRLAAAQACFFWGSITDAVERLEALAVDLGSDAPQVLVSVWLWRMPCAIASNDMDTAGQFLSLADACACPPVMAAERDHHRTYLQVARRASRVALRGLHALKKNAERLNSTGLQFMAEYHLGRTHTWLTAFETAAEHHEAALDLARALATPINIASALRAAGEACLVLGKYDRADTLLTEAVALQARLGLVYYRIITLCVLTTLRLQQGRFGEADDYLRDALRCTASTGGPGQSHQIARLLGVTALLERRPHEAHAPLHRALHGFRDKDATAESANCAQLAALAAALDPSAKSISAPPLGEQPTDAALLLDTALSLAQADRHEIRHRAGVLLSQGPSGVADARRGHVLLRAVVQWVDERPSDASADQEPTAPITLRAAADGREFTYGAVSGDLKRRPLLARLLTFLIQERRHQPGQFAPLDAVFATVWQGDHAVRQARRQRVHSSIYALRRMGLSDVIESDPSGYRIAVTVMVDTVSDSVT
ncbi:MAG: tetratricopeptide (TPR) repeat protein [Bradymonadia bacterium]|jgi:tetratricopeptide (TPR) repeat protein